MNGVKQYVLVRFIVPCLVKVDVPAQHLVANQMIKRAKVGTLKKQMTWWKPTCDGKSMCFFFLLGGKRKTHNFWLFCSRFYVCKVRIFQM